MAWIAAAIVFCFFMWKWPRRTLKGLGICAIIGAVLAAILAGAMKYQDYKADKLRKSIKMVVDYSPTRCEDKEYPLVIGIGNAGDSTVYKVEFSIRAYAHGRSTNLVEYGHYSCDRILEPNGHTYACFPLPKLKENHRPENLDWKAYVTWVETSGE